MYGVVAYSCELGNLCDVHTLHVLHAQYHLLLVGKSVNGAK
jgi:hypothetical protein